MDIATFDSLDWAGVGPLLAVIDQLWDERAQHRSRTRARIEKLKPRAAVTPQGVLDLPSPEPSRAMTADTDDDAGRKGAAGARLDLLRGGAPVPAAALSAPRS